MIGETKLFPTLYVGEHEHGLFAVPSLVDKETMMISPAGDDNLDHVVSNLFLMPGYLQIEGPKNTDNDWESKPSTDSNINEGTSQIAKDKSSVLLFGEFFMISEKQSG